MEHYKSIEEQIQSHRELYSEYQNLLRQQEKSLETLIEEVKPISVKIKEYGAVFTHPSINVHSKRGPVLAEDQDGYVFIYDFERNRVIRILIGDDEEKTYFLSHLVRTGLYGQAAEGLNHVKGMIQKYNDELSKEISDGLALIEKYK